jgi:hypothetical protein
MIVNQRKVREWDNLKTKALFKLADMEDRAKLTALRQGSKVRKGVRRCHQRPAAKYKAKALSDEGRCDGLANGRAQT